ncbi:serine/threonine protein kinase [Neorhodopirellula pilleata]|uniref:Serine/threonine-protein kinase PrkC n=1 Tax=Neorhodopirellula pilleata TaxID=2714738 RepID=A0A5C6B0B4_9BACT|nr:protein kinase [Neorhodopirellula pilleata]TWU03854.1 Serine/threonine-protein kinase PrkC [Neorhodopirellula pilleata]
MSGAGSTKFGGFDSSTMIWINRRCDEFERLWQQTQHASLRDYLQSIDDEPPLASESFRRELIYLDVFYRTRFGIEIHSKAYQELIPTYDDHQISQLMESAIGMDVSPHEWQAGQRVGDYVIEALIGRGGMGEVYRATHELMGRQVAIKVLRQSIHHDPLARKRFEREVHATAGLSHPHILAALDARQINGVLCLVTQWVEGETLSTIVAQDGPIPVEETLQIGIQIAEALQYAHQSGVIHRDIKPSNLLLDFKGDIKVLDLGLAKLRSELDGVSSSEPLTSSQHMLGTAEFVSPEQARSPDQVDARCDIYSLGCTLFYLLSGKAPYQGDTGLDTVLQHCQAEVPGLVDVVGVESIPIALSDYVRSMMAKAPDERPGTMSEVKEALSQWLEPCDQPTLSSRDPENVRTPNDSVRSRPFQYAGLAVAVVLMLGAVNHFFGFGTDLKATANGLRFDGQASYAEVEGFNIPINTIAIIEAWVTPQPGPSPSNLVNWLGDESLILFLSKDDRWGVAAMHRGRPILEVSAEPVRFGQRQMVAAVRDTDQLQLWIDGERVQTRSLNFEPFPSRLGLYLGGVPEGILPIEQGPRFFSGELHGLRLSMGKGFIPAATAEQLTDTAATIALFRFDENRGQSTRDHTENQWNARLVNVVWVP